MKAASLVVVLGAIWAGWQDPTAPSEKKPTEPLKFAPRDYFVKACQRCHGVDGSNYEAGFAKKDSDEMLRHDIDRMAKGAGNQPIGSAEIEVQMAYHRLISDGKPF